MQRLVPMSLVSFEHLSGANFNRNVNKKLDQNPSFRTVTTRNFF